MVAQILNRNLILKFLCFLKLLSQKLEDSNFELNRLYHEISVARYRYCTRLHQIALLAFSGDFANKTKTKQNTKQRFLDMNSCPIRRSIIQ